MIKMKANIVCYDLELDLNKLHHLSTTRGGVETSRGKHSGVNHLEEPQPDPVEEEPLEDEPLEEEEPLEDEEPFEEEEPSEGEESSEKGRIHERGGSQRTGGTLVSSRTGRKCIEMCITRREPPIVTEISSDEEEEEDWVINHDMYGYGDEFTKS